MGLGQPVNLTKLNCLDSVRIFWGRSKTPQLTKGFIMQKKFGPQDKETRERTRSVEMQGCFDCRLSKDCDIKPDDMKEIPEDCPVLHGRFEFRKKPQS